MKTLYFESKPVFSLSKIPRDLLTDAVKEREEAIELVLKNGRSAIEGVKDALIAVAPLPIPLALLGGEKTMPITTALQHVVDAHLTPAPVQALLGLLAAEGATPLSKRFADVLRIETFSVYPEHYFLDHLDRPSQLCLKRGNKGMMLDVSEYIKNGIVNYGKRFSGNSIRGLFYKSPIEAASEEEQKERFNGRMIG